MITFDFLYTLKKKALSLKVHKIQSGFFSISLNKKRKYKLSLSSLIRSLYNSWANFHVLSFQKRFIFSKVKIKSRNEFGFSPETEMGLMRTFDAYYQDQPKIIEKEKKSSESLYKTFVNNKGTYKFNSFTYTCL